MKKFEVTFEIKVPNSWVHEDSFDIFEWKNDIESKVRELTMVFPGNGNEKECKINVVKIQEK